MRIAVLSDDGTSVAAHGGRAGGCVICDADEKSAVHVEYRQIQRDGETCDGHVHGDHHEHHGGHSHDTILSLVADCDIVIGGGIGWRLQGDLRERGIEVVLTDEIDAATAAQKFAMGELIAIEGRSCGH